MCWNCGKVGHIRRVCRAPPTKMRGKRGGRGRGGRGRGGRRGGGGGGGGNIVYLTIKQ